MTTTQARAEEHHRHLIDRLAETIRKEYRRAVDAGMRDPVALVLDLYDKETRAIAESTGRRAEIASAIARSRASGQPAIAVAYLPRDLVEVLIEPFAAPVAADLHDAAADEDEILLVLATAEMTSLHALPIRRR